MKSKKQHTNKTYTFRARILFMILLPAVVLFSASAQKTRVACVGNSVTFGYKIDQREENCYPAQLQELLGDQYLVGNFGKSGSTLLRKGHRPYMEQEEFKKAVAFNPDIIIVSLGLNDTDPRNWPNYRDEFISDYMALIQSFKKADGSMPQVWIGKMTPIFHTHSRFKSGTRDWFWQIQETVEQVAVNCNARLIDWHNPLHAHPELFPDALHPIKEGAAIMAKMVYQHITGNFGGTKFAPVFGNHMVLQRNNPIPVWGESNRNEQIHLELNNIKTVAQTGYDGKWQATFPPMKAGGPYQLTIKSSSGNIVFKDVMIGEVWLCSGQSNMAFTVARSVKGSETLSQNHSSAIRLMNFHPIAQTNDAAWDNVILNRVNNLDYFTGKWEPATNTTISNFSAIGWYFGESLHQELNVPVGLIQIAVGGAPTEAFIDRQTLEFNPHLVDLLYHWDENDFVMEWCRQRAEKNISKANNPLQRHPYQPAYLFESGIKSVTGFPIKGVLWYQGESNAHNIELHEILFPALIGSWRKAWNNPKLPFLVVQLSSLNRPSWPHFRDSQRRLASEIPDTWMVVSSDHGNPTDVHPKSKYPVGERLAQTTLNQVYKLKHTPSGSISIEWVKRKKDQIIISVSETKTLQTSDTGPVKEFETAGADGLFSKADVILKKNCIIIFNNKESVKTIRYGWKPYSEANIVNEHGIPLSTFSVDVP